MTGAVRIAIVLAAAVAATIVANFVLLGVATGRQEPVGKLSPRAELVPSLPAHAAPAPPHDHRGRESERQDD